MKKIVIALTDCTGEGVCFKKDQEIKGIRKAAVETLIKAGKAKEVEPSKVSATK